MGKLKKSKEGNQSFLSSMPPSWVENDKNGGGGDCGVTGELNVEIVEARELNQTIKDGQVFTVIHLGDGGRLGTRTTREIRRGKSLRFEEAFSFSIPVDELGDLSGDIEVWERVSLPPIAGKKGRGASPNKAPPASHKCLLLARLSLPLSASVTDKWYEMDSLQVSREDQNPDRTPSPAPASTPHSLAPTTDILATVPESTSPRGDASPPILPLVVMRVSSRLRFMGENDELTGRQWITNSVAESTSPTFDTYGIRIPPQYMSLSRSFTQLHAITTAHRDKAWEAYFSTLSPSSSERDWKEVKESQTGDRLLWMGIPAKWRQEAYSQLIGRSIKNADRYRKYCESAKTMSNVATDQIGRDLHRTVTGINESVLSHANGIRSLERVLSAFAVHNPKIGYCQAMNYISAHLLFILEESVAFAVLCHICDVLFPGYYVVSMQGLIVDMHLIDAILHMRAPRLMDMIDTVDCPITLFTSQWLISLCLTAFPTELGYRVLDVVLAHGPPALFAVIIAFFKLCENELLALPKPDDQRVLEFVKSEAAGLYDYDALLNQAKTELSVWGWRVPSIRAHSTTVLKARVESTVEREAVHKLSKLLSIPPEQCQSLYATFVENSRSKAFKQSPQTPKRTELVVGPVPQSPSSTTTGAWGKRTSSLADLRAMDYKQFTLFLEEQFPEVRLQARLLFELFDLTENQTIDLSEAILCCATIRLISPVMDSAQPKCKEIQRVPVSPRTPSHLWAPSIGSSDGDVEDAELSSHPASPYVSTPPSSDPPSFPRLSSRTHGVRPATEATRVLVREYSGSSDMLDEEGYQSSPTLSPAPEFPITPTHGPSNPSATPRGDEGIGRVVTMLRALFRAFDADQDGKLDLSDVRHMLRALFSFARLPDASTQISASLTKLQSTLPAPTPSPASPLDSLSPPSPSPRHRSWVEASELVGVLQHDASVCHSLAVCDTGVALSDSGVPLESEALWPPNLHLQRKPHSPSTAGTTVL